MWTGDTAYWYKFNKEENRKISIDEIVNSRNLLTIRFSTENEIIDIWTSDNQEYYGRQTYFTCSHNEKKGNKYFSKSEKIGKDTAKLVFQMFKYYKILSMPVQDSIKGWYNGLDGRIYLVEYATPDQYSFKSYWTPSEFENIPEAVNMNEFITRLEVLLNQEHKLEIFFNSLPIGKCYRYGSMSIRYKK
jgi:hypothetical protein